MTTRHLTAAGTRLIQTRAISFTVRRRTLVVTAAALALLVVLGMLSVMSGSTQLSVSQVLDALAGGDDSAILYRVRVPRLVAGIAIGAALGTSGAVFQSVSRNPLGSPDIIGFVAGAATGAVVAIVVLSAPPALVAASAVVSGIATALLVLALSRRSDGTPGYRLILVGIGVGAFLQSANALLLTRSNADAAIAAQIWLTGSLNAIGWPDTIIAIVGLVVASPVIVVLARHLAVMELGDDFAAQVGVRIDVVRVAALIAATALAAFATAAAGPIAFVALAAPHVARQLAGTPGTPFLLAGVLGATLLIGADVAAMWLPFGFRVPVALMTSLLGGLYLLWLLTRSRWR